MGERVGPLVSVLMTSYNREAFIADAIESVLSSSYKNYELIIVDDKSLDRTVEIARYYEKNDSRIKLYVNETNLGDYHNRNRAASYAVGKYIKYVDSDDLIYPHGLEVMVRCMEQYPDSAVGIMSLINQEDTPYPFELKSHDAYQYHFYNRGLFDIGPTAMIFCTEKFKSVGGFSGKRFVGDLEINLRLAARYEIVKMPSSLVFWRKHEGQEFVIGNNSTGYLELLLPLYRSEFNNHNCPLTEKQKDAIIRYHSNLSARHLIKLAFVKGHPRKAYILYKELALSLKDLYYGIFSIKKPY